MKSITNKTTFALYTILVTFVSLKPMNGVTIGSWDKAGHLVIYGLFAVLGYRVAKTPRIFLYICFAIIMYSGLMEFAQSFMPGRLMSAYDLLANIAGVALGGFVARLALGAKNDI